MLIKGYSYYFNMLATEALLSVLGILSVVVLLAAIVMAMRAAPGKGNRFLLTGLPLAVILFGFAFYGTEVTYDEQPELLAGTRVDLSSQYEDCGIQETRWQNGSLGMGNICGQGCFRGNTVEQKMKMSGFPPAMMTKRAIQCWKREPVAQSDYAETWLKNNQ